MARIAGGPQSIVDALANQLLPDQVEFEHRLTGIERANDGFKLTFNSDPSSIAVAHKVIFAAPLRLLCEQVAWNGILDEQMRALMLQTSTWMAVQAKAVIGYETTFWKKMGLSGRVASQLGPLVEIHDHTSHGEAHPALFGFVGLPAGQRDADDLKLAIVEQLVRCFGIKASKPTHITIKDWAHDDSICSQADLSSPVEHPTPRPDGTRRAFCDNGIAFAVAETALHHPGLIDGALESGERAARLMLESLGA